MKNFKSIIKTATDRAVSASSLIKELRSEDNLTEFLDYLNALATVNRFEGKDFLALALLTTSVNNSEIRDGELVKFIAINCKEDRKIDKYSLIAAIKELGRTKDTNVLTTENINTK